MLLLKISVLLFVAYFTVFVSGHQTVTTALPRSYAAAANANNRATHQQPQSASQFVHQPSNDNNAVPSYAQAAQGGQSASSNIQRTNQQRPSATVNSPPQRQTSQTSTTRANNVSDDDLRTLSETLLREDTNNAGSTVRANWQGRTYGSDNVDYAPAPLLTVPARTLQGATISKLKHLFDNYEKDSSIAEHVTTSEQTENAAFLDAIMPTQVMSKTRRFLIEKNLLSNEQGSLRTLLQKLWFTMFPRAGGRTEIGSSSFEHVFMGEIHRGAVSGFHNWVFFNNEESTGRVNYRGFTRYVDLGGRGSIVKYSFQWGNVTKPVTSMFIGTSPELEMALYTVCFLSRPGGRCPVRLSGQPFTIQTYTFTYHGDQYIGSAYPEI